MSRIRINGEERDAVAESIAAMVEELGLCAPTVLIEHNGLALRRSEWAGARLGDGDRIEILFVAAGG